MGVSPMVHLVTVHGAFHAKVIAARLGSDGILTELRGAAEGPYPVLGEVGVYVAESDVAVARELLLADEVESAFDEADDPDEAAEAAARTPPVPVWLAVAAIILVACLYVTRGL